MFGARHVDRVAVRVVVSGDPTHRPFGEGDRISDQAQVVRVEASDGRSTLALKAQVLSDQRSVREGQQPVVAAVDRKFPLGDHLAVRIQPVEVRAVDRVNGPVGVGQDCPTPHVVPARQVF